MTDMGPLRCSRFLKILIMFMLTITPVLASGRQMILLLEEEEVKEVAQGESGEEDENSLESGVINEDSDEWDEFGHMEDSSVDELDPGSWRKILDETLSRENISSNEEGLYVSGVNKMMLAVSEGEPELMKEAISDLHLSADGGYAHAQSTLGLLFEIGSGVEQSDAKAFLYHHFAAEGGNFQSKMALAYTYYRQQMYEKSVKLYAELASVAVASFFSFKEPPLVEPVRINDGAEENKEALRKSRGEEDDDFQIIEYQAQKGSAMAMYRLGIFYYFGLRGVHRDHRKALSWFLKAVEKGDTNSMEFLGEIYARGSGVERNFTKALEWFNVASRRKRFSAYNGIGYLYMKGHGVEKKNYTKAREYFKKAAENDDPNGHGNYNLGVLYLKGLGVKKDTKTASRYFITAANAGQPKAFYQLAKMFQKGIGLKKDLMMGTDRDFERAAEAYMHARFQSNAQAMFNLGYMHEHGEGLPFDFHLAKRYYDQALETNRAAKLPVMLALLSVWIRKNYGGSCLVKLEGDIHQGIAHYKKALLYNWHYADAMYNLGVAYGELLKFDMAIVMYELALHFNQTCAEACNNLGVIYKDRDNLDKAVECYQMALSIKPSFSQSLNNLGVVYTVQGKMDAAASMIEKAIMANPAYAEAYNNLGVLHRDAGNITLAIEAYERCLQIDPDSRNAGQNRLLAMNYIYEGEDDKLYITHREWGKRFMNLYPQYTTWDNPKDPERSLVIGYVSPDYFTHSVSYFIEAPLACHEYSKYKVVVYSAVVKADAKTHKFRERVLKKGGLWRDIYGIDEKKVASIVREDKVDILVELTGHTANNKLGLMACRPAPIQATWIGYPNTTGLPTIDYRFTDSLADPLDTRQKHVEELVRLPGCFLCYTPSPEAGPVVETPALSNGFITFGSFNNLAKITLRVLRVWARILCAIPTSRLVVKCKPFCCDSVRQRFLSTLEDLGLESLRVDLLPLILLNHDHMQAYSLMDISLDTFPYAGTTTTCESLYMGVPCVTMAGSVHAHNVGVSLLHQVGLTNLIAQTEDDYVSKALELASNIPLLSSLRMSLRERMLKSNLSDGHNFVHGLESTYRKLWHRYCEGDVPSLRRCNMEKLPEGPTTVSEIGIGDMPNEKNVKEISPTSTCLLNGVNPASPPVPIFSNPEAKLNGGTPDSEAMGNQCN